jgi:hypothetical protein
VKTGPHPIDKNQICSAQVVGHGKIRRSLASTTRSGLTKQAFLSVTLPMSRVPDRESEPCRLIRSPLPTTNTVRPGTGQWESSPLSAARACLSAVLFPPCGTAAGM